MGVYDPNNAKFYCNDIKLPLIWTLVIWFWKVYALNRSLLMLSLFYKSTLHCLHATFQKSKRPTETVLKTAKFTTNTFSFDKLPMKNQELWMFLWSSRTLILIEWMLNLVILEMLLPSISFQNSYFQTRFCIYCKFQSVQMFLGCSHSFTFCYCFFDAFLAFLFQFFVHP